MKLRFYRSFVLFLFSFFTGLIYAQVGCDEPPCMPGIVYCNQVSGSSAGYTPGIPGPVFPCGTAENNQWFSIVADSTTVMVEIDIYNCEIGAGLQMLLYDQNLNPVSNCFSEEGQFTGSIIATDLQVGEIYWLMIDGWAADICDFDLLITGNQIMEGDTVPNPGPLSTPNNSIQVCTETEICFSSSPNVPGQIYFWDFNLPVEYVSGRNTNSVCVKFTEVGVDTVALFFINGCLKSDVQKYVIEVVEPPSRDLGVIELCQNKFPFELNGFYYNQPGTYSQRKQIISGCDSVLNFELRTLIDETIISFDTLCGLDTFSFRDTFYTTSGLHVYKTDYPNGEACDSVFHINLLFLQESERRIMDDICEDEYYFFQGDTLVTSGTYTAKYQAANGCDSLIVLELRVHPNYNHIIDTTVTQNTHIINRLITNDTIFVIDYRSEFGCDSTVIFDVSVETSGIKATTAELPFVLFPNPVKEELMLLNYAHEKLESIAIFNSSGQLVKLIHAPTMHANSNYSIRISDLSSGSYILKLKGSKGELLGNMRFIKL